MQSYSYGVIIEGRCAFQFEFAFQFAIHTDLTVLQNRIINLFGQVKVSGNFVEPTRPPGNSSEHQALGEMGESYQDPNLPRNYSQISLLAEPRLPIPLEQSELQIIETGGFVLNTSSDCAEEINGTDSIPTNYDFQAIDGQNLEMNEVGKQSETNESEILMHLNPPFKIECKLRIPDDENMQAYEKNGRIMIHQ